MVVTVQLYGGLKDFFEASLALEVSSEALVSDVAQLLLAQSPACAGLLSSCSYAVADRMVPENTELAPGQILDVMPPFSGG